MCLLMCNVVQLCLAKFACDPSCVKMADRFVSRRYSLKNKFGDRISDKTDQLFASAFHFGNLFPSDKSRYFAHWQPRRIIDNSPKLGYGVHRNSLKLQWLHKRESLQRFAMLLAWTTQNVFFLINALLKVRNQDAIFTWNSGPEIPTDSDTIHPPWTYGWCASCNSSLCSFNWGKKQH